jgi:hypothetical protein
VRCHVKIVLELLGDALPAISKLHMKQKLKDSNPGKNGTRAIGMGVVPDSKKGAKRSLVKVTRAIKIQTLKAC